jgi:dihydrofolate reductase
MAKLIYAINTSLDGSIEDDNGSLDWTNPDEEYFAFINDFERAFGTYLYGRRLYESMIVWETLEGPDNPAIQGTLAPWPQMQNFAQIWRAADKIVYSRTLQSVSSARTRIERELDPDAVRRLKSELSQDITIGGAELAGYALRAGLVDEIHLFVAPVILGAGKPALPGNLRIELRLQNERRLASGIVHLHYAVASAP